MVLDELVHVAIERETCLVLFHRPDSILLNKGRDEDGTQVFIMFRSRNSV